MRDTPPDQPRELLAYGCRPRKYDAGESVTNAYGVWDEYRIDGSPPPGTDRWEDAVSIWHDLSSTEEAETTLTWDSHVPSKIQTDRWITDTYARLPTDCPGRPFLHRTYSGD